MGKAEWMVVTITMVFLMVSWVVLYKNKYQKFRDNKLEYKKVIKSVRDI